MRISNLHNMHSCRTTSDAYRNLEPAVSASGRLIINKAFPTYRSHTAARLLYRPELHDHAYTIGKCRPSRRITFAASNSGATVDSTPMMPVAVPQSQDEAVGDAVAAVKVQLQGTAISSKQAKKKGGFSNAMQRPNRFAIEIPTADDSADGTAQLTYGVLSAMCKQLPAAPGSFTAVIADTAAADAALKRGGGWQVITLQAACRQDRIGGVLLIVAPKVADVALVEQLLDDVWAGPAAVVLNAEWATAPVPQAYRAVVDSIAVVFSFLPIAVKGLVGNKEGAVLRKVLTAGAAATTQWRILYQTKGQFCQVGQTKARPKPEDLELAFSYASAATSPLTGVVKFFKSAADRMTGKNK